MVALPRATTVVQDQAGAAATGLDVICIFTPCAVSADMVPRMLGSAAAVYTQHGYCEGVEYAALHAEKTRKPFMVCGLPIAVEGEISREDTTGNSGSASTTITAGADGVLAEHDGVLVVDHPAGTVVTIGTDQIKLSYSLDGGRTFKKYRLGTAASFPLPYVAATIAFGGGTLVGGDTIHTWHGSAPLSDSDGWATARANLAAQQKGFRSILLVGDLQDSDEASGFLTQLNAYETENERFVYGRAGVYDRAVATRLSVVTRSMTGTANITFNDDVGGDTATRSEGSWIDDGVRVGDMITFGSPLNSGTFQVTSVSNTVLGTSGLTDEADVAGLTPTFSTGLSFDDSSETITRSRGSWLADGFRPGDTVVIAGTSGAVNDGTFVISTLTALVMTLAAGSVDADEIIGADALTQFTGPGAQTKAAWMAELDAEFAPIDDAFRISLSAGRGRVLSPFSGWLARRPAGWAASLREYQHDLHRTTWRKGDGPSGFDLFDADGNLAEWDDRVDGEAASAARFTALRTWANGPIGSFIALSLTRASEGSLLLHTSNVAVVNLVCTTVQLNTEDAAIGVDLDLNADGTAAPESLATIASQVNNALSQAVLVNKLGEGKRASAAVWTPDADTLFNVAEPTLTGVTDLLLKGIVHSVRTAVVVKTGA